MAKITFGAGDPINFFTPEEKGKHEVLGVCFDESTCVAFPCYSREGDRIEYEDAASIVTIQTIPPDALIIRLNHIPKDWEMMFAALIKVAQSFTQNQPNPK